MNKRTWFLSLCWLVLLLLPCAALGEAAQEGVVLYDECLRPYACFLPGAPLETIATSESAPIYCCAGWELAGFPTYSSGATTGYLRTGSLDAVASTDAFPTATLLHDFQLESPNSGLSWSDESTFLKKGDVVSIVGMDAGRWYVYANGYYGSIPKMLYDLDEAQPAEGYLEVDADTAARLKAMIPDYSVTAADWQLQVSQAEQLLADAYATYGRQTDLWPWETQLAAAAADALLQRNDFSGIIAPGADDRTQEEAVAMATTLVQEVLGDAFPLEGCRVGATFRIQTNGMAGWDIRLIGTEDTICVYVGAAQAELVQDNTFHSYAVQCILADAWTQREAEYAALCEERGDFGTWTAEQKALWEPNRYAMPDERYYPLDKVEEMAAAYAAEQHQYDYDGELVARADLLRIPSCYGADAACIYHVALYGQQEDGSLCWQEQVFMDVWTGAVIAANLGNG